MPIKYNEVARSALEKAVQQERLFPAPVHQGYEPEGINAPWFRNIYYKPTPIPGMRFGDIIPPMAAAEGMTKASEALGAGNYGTAGIEGGLAMLDSLDPSPIAWGAMGSGLGMIKRSDYARELDDVMKDNPLYHSGTSDIVEDMAYGLEPQHGSWIREVAEGATENADELLDASTPLAWLSDKPEWIKMQVSRKLGKPLSDITDDDVIANGHLAIFDRENLPDNVYRVGDEGLSEGPYSTLTDPTGAKVQAYETDLYGESDFGERIEPFGVERNEWITTETLEPDYQLTGNELIDFMRRNNQSVDVITRNGKPVHPLDKRKKRK